MIVAPNHPRAGVVSGFPLALPGSGLAPLVGKGVLFAQGTMFRPGAGPTAPDAPDDSFHYLAYNSSTGLYWSSNVAGDTAGDAVIGWAVAEGGALVEVSKQDVAVGAEPSGSGGGTGGGTGMPPSGGGSGATPAGGYYLIPVLSVTPTLAGAISDSDTSVTLSSATGIPEFSFYGLCGSEYVLCDAGTGVSRTVTRGALGTTAAAHASGALVTILTALPDVTRGENQEIILAGPVAVFTPLSTVAISVTLMLQQDSTGGWPVTLSADFLGIDPEKFDTTPDAFITMVITDPRAAGKWYSPAGPSTALPLS